MKSLGFVLTLVTLVSIGSGTLSHAATHAKQHVVQGTHAQAASSASCPVSNPALCGGSCPHGTAATATGTAATVQKSNGTACPVSDPSKCPAGCRRNGAASTTAVAANTRH